MESFCEFLADKSKNEIRLHYQEVEKMFKVMNTNIRFYHCAIGGAIGSSCLQILPPAER